MVNGTWKEGDRIPSEAELCAMFSASRMTANRAVRELTEQGYLVRTQGAGTFVAKATVSATILEIRSIKQEIEASGGTHRSRVLRLERVVIRPKLATEIDVPAGTEMILLEAIHSTDGRPIQFERRFVTPGLAPGFEAQDFTDGSASDYLLQTVSYNDAEHQISAIAADATLAAHLAISEGAACLRLLRRTHLGGMLVTRAEFVHPGADFTLTGKLPVPNQLRRAV
jgi:GntR family histidine utilization transcriptional repressor